MAAVYTLDSANEAIKNADSVAALEALEKDLLQHVPSFTLNQLADLLGAINDKLVAITALRNRYQ